MQLNKKIFFLFLLIILSISVTAQTLPTRYWGDIFIDELPASAETKVEVFANAEIIADTTTPSVEDASDETYFVNILTTHETELTFKVWGIDAEQRTWIIDDSGQFINLDLSVNTLANDGVCSYDQACTSGHCCTGICKTSCGTTSTLNTNTGNSGGGGGGGGNYVAPTPVVTTPVPTNNFQGSFGSVGQGNSEEGDSESADQLGSDDSNTETQVNTGNNDRDAKSGLESATGGVTIGNSSNIVSTPAVLFIVLGISVLGSLVFFYFRRR